MTNGPDSDWPNVLCYPYYFNSRASMGAYTARSLKIAHTRYGGLRARGLWRCSGNARHDKLGVSCPSRCARPQVAFHTREDVLHFDIPVAGKHSAS